MIKTMIKRTTLLMLLLVVATGCAVKPDLFSGLLMSKTEMVQLMQQRQYRYYALSALAQVKMTRKNKSWSTTQAILLENPNRLRIDILNFFSQLMLQMSVDGPRLVAYVPAEKIHYTGTPTLDNIQRFTGLPIPLTDLVALLLEKIPPGVLETAQVSAWEKGLLLGVAPGVEYRLEFDEKRVVSVVYSVNSYVIYHVLYTVFGAGSDFPQHIELRVPMNDVVVKLRFTDIELNPVLMPAQFELILPPGTMTRAITPLTEGS